MISACVNMFFFPFLGGHKEFQRRHRELCEDALLPGAVPRVPLAGTPCPPSPSLSGELPLGSPIEPAGNYKIILLCLKKISLEYFQLKLPFLNLPEQTVSMLIDDSFGNYKC